MEQSYGFGIAGGLDPDIVRTIARQAENHGYTTFWANDTPHGDGLATLEVAASVTSTIRLGVGVIPLDRRNAENITASVRDLGLPIDRLTLGVGSGGATGGLAIVRDGAVAVRESMGANLLCINPTERSHMELRNLVREAAAVKPSAPKGWKD